MEGIIKVNPEVLMNTSSEFNSEGQQINNLTTQMMELVTSLQGSWIGEAAASYTTKFSGLQDDIQRMVGMVQEHSLDLQQMAQTYITAENANVEASQALASDVIS